MPKILLRWPTPLQRPDLPNEQLCDSPSEAEQADHDRPRPHSCSRGIMSRPEVFLYDSLGGHHKRISLDWMKQMARRERIQLRIQRGEIR